MTELLWEGKYRDGQRALPDRAPCTLRDDEIADRPAEDEAAPSARREDGWRNRLIHGDTRDVLPALLPAFAGCVNLVYIDPPFATGADQTIAIPLPRADLGVTPPVSIERVAYRDTWRQGPGLDGYLHWFFETATLLRELLAEGGALVVHCDWRADAPLRLILDEVFGAGNFRNAIAWAYRSGGASRRGGLARKHDTLLLYARSPRFTIRPQTERQYLRKPFIGSHRDAAGRHYVDTLLRDVLDGELTLVRDGQLVRRNLRPVLNVSRERLGYPTQKPLGLIELLIEIATDPGDLVLDCCCGSGTTPAAAAITGRRWIAADSGPFALAATRARLLALPAARPFAVQHVAARDGDASRAAGGNAGTLHVSAQGGSSPPSPASALWGERAAEGGGEREGREAGAKDAKEESSPSDLASALRGEGEPMDGVAARPASPSAVPFSPSALSSVPSVSSVVNLSAAPSPRPPRASAASACSVTLTVEGLTLPLHDLLAGVVTPDARSGCAWIAYWLVDWEHSGEIFRIGAWSGRPRGGAAPPATLTHTYTRPGRHTIAVRAVDLLGRVTTTTLEVEL
ncbi:MAG TPA: DNA methyltransferase [Ktedonobacterales bacterium]